MDPKLRCKRVHSPKGARSTKIEWGDGHEGVYPHLVLRGYCPCAGCQGHEGSIKFIEPSDNQLEIEGIESVGNYALRFTWFDGHGSGLYSFRYLRALCQCDECQPKSPSAARGEMPRL
jgi:DUF971 family protein